MIVKDSTKKHVRRILSELSFARNPGYESERWQQERLNKVQLEDKLEQIQQNLASKGVELVIITDDKSGSLADNEIKVVINRKKSGMMGMLGSEDSQTLMFYAWPNGISVKDMDSGQDPLSLDPEQVDRWLQQNISESKRHFKFRLQRILHESMVDLGIAVVDEEDYPVIASSVDEYDGNKARLFRMGRMAQSLEARLDDGDDLPEWVQDKITTAEDRLSAVFQYIDYKLHRIKSDGNVVTEGDIRNMARKALLI